jgi:ligand-binding sensor domain-containing protein
MVISLRRVLCFCALAISLPLFAQWDLGHIALTTIEGLPSNTIYGVAHDKKGAVYIATSKGFCRYNGTEVSVLSKEEALEFYDFAETNANLIFTQTFQGKIFTYTDSSRIFREANFISQTSEFSRFLVGRNNQLFRYTNSKIEQLPISEKDSTKLVYTQASLGRILVCNTYGKYLVCLYTDTILYINQESLRVEKGLSVRTSVNSNLINKYQQLVYFSPNQGVFRIIQNDSIGKIMRLPYFNLSDKYSCATVLSDSSVAIGTWGGLYLYNKHFEFIGKYFQNSQISSLCQDKEGNLLIGTQQEGLLIVKDRRCFSIPTSFYLTHQFKTCSMTSAGDSLLVLGSFDGRLAFFDRQGRLTKLMDLGKKSEVQSLAFNPFNNKLYAHCNNLDEIDIEQKKVMSTNSSLSIKDFLFEDKARLWAATSYGLSKYENTKTYEHLFKNLWIKGLHKVGNDLVLFAKSGLYRYDFKKEILRRVSTGGDNKNDLLSEVKDFRFLNDSASLLLIKNEVYVLSRNRLEKIFQLKNDVAIKAIPYRNQVVVLGKKGLYSFSKEKVKGAVVTLPFSQQDFSDYSLAVSFSKTVLFGVQSFKYFDTIKSLFNDNSSLYLVKTEGTFVKKGNVYQSSYFDNQLNVYFEVLPNIASGTATKVLYRIKGLANNKWTLADKGFMLEEQRLPAGTYTLEAKAIGATGEVSSVQRILLKVAKPFYATNWFYMLVFSAVSLIIYTWFSIRERKILLKKKAEIALERLKIKALNAELKTIRAQMNPHFIFNSINSIQTKILGNEPLKAYENLSSFATLLRQSLDYSCMEYITLAKELEFLQNYVKLELLRTDNVFEHRFEVADSIPTKDLLFPSLISQPFVENAIRHGLLHSQSKKILIIRVSKVESSYLFEIIDNGIGIEQSNIINQTKNKSHSSFATKAIKDRIELINAGTKMSIELQILNESPGTRICLWIQYNKLNEN